MNQGSYFSVVVSRVRGHSLLSNNSSHCKSCHPSEIDQNTRRQIHLSVSLAQESVAGNDENQRVHWDRSLSENYAESTTAHVPASDCRAPGSVTTRAVYPLASPQARVQNCTGGSHSLLPPHLRSTDDLSSWACSHL